MTGFGDVGPCSSAKDRGTQAGLSEYDAYSPKAVRLLEPACKGKILETREKGYLGKV